MKYGSSGKLKAWYQASRPPFFIATLIPLAAGGRLAALDGEWNGLLWGAIVLASFLVHLNTNLSNDYFEYENDKENIGGTRVLQQGLISLKEMRNAIIVFYLLAFLLGMWILLQARTWILLVYILFAALSSLFYTAPPLRYAYRGLGELMVGLNMGPVMVSGTYVAMSGRHSSEAFLYSLPIAVGVAFILFYQSLSDIDSDRDNGKYTLAVRLGETRIHGAILAFSAAEILSMLFLIQASYLQPGALLSLLSAGFAWKISLLWRRRSRLEDLHGQGQFARFFYLFNGLLLLIFMN